MINEKCPRCRGSGKFNFGGIQTKCRCRVVEISVSPVLDITPPSLKKKRKRRDGQGAIDNAS
jgi:hypothetical protein